MSHVQCIWLTHSLTDLMSMQLQLISVSFQKRTSLAMIPYGPNHESRLSANTSAEWQLNPKILHSCLTDIAFSPSVDLFASRLNKKFDKFVSCKPEPGALQKMHLRLTYKSHLILSPRTNFILFILEYECSI